MSSKKFALLISAIIVAAVVAAIVILTVVGTNATTPPAMQPKASASPIPGQPSPVAATAESTAPATPSASAVVAKECDGTEQSLPVGSCIIPSEMSGGAPITSPAKILQLCHSARNAWFGVFVGRETTNDDTSNGMLCALSVGLTTNPADIQGIPDKDALPKWWPSSEGVEDWYDGRFIVKSYSQTSDELITQAYDRNGRPISLAETRDLIEKFGGRYAG